MPDSARLSALLRLVDDPSQIVRDAVGRELLRLGDGLESTLRARGIGDEEHILAALELVEGLKRAAAATSAPEPPSPAGGEAPASDRKAPGSTTATGTASSSTTPGTTGPSAPRRRPPLPRDGRSRESRREFRRPLPPRPEPGETDAEQGLREERDQAAERDAGAGPPPGTSPEPSDPGAHEPTGEPPASPGRYFIGQLVRHRRHGYRGVVVEVDAQCRAEESWYRGNRTKPSREQPWYHVLVHDSQHVTYAAESNLLPDESMKAVKNPLVPYFFRAFSRSRGLYERNDRPWPGWPTS